MLQQATVQNVENHFGWTLPSQVLLRSLAKAAATSSALKQ